MFLGLRTPSYPWSYQFQQTVFQVGKEAAPEAYIYAAARGSFNYHPNMPTKCGWAVLESQTDGDAGMFGQWLLQFFLNFSVSLCFHFPLPLQQTKVFFQPCIRFKIRTILIVNYQTQISLKLCDIITTPTLPHTGWCWCHGGNSKIKVSLILFYTIWGAAALAVQILD